MSVSKVRAESAKFIQFGTLTASEWKAFAVCEINRPTPRDKQHLDNTPYDPRLGRIENGFSCETCGKFNDVCPGHFGCIILPIPVYNKVYMSYITKTLQCVCPACARPRLKPQSAIMKGVPQKRGAETLKMFAKKCEKVHICPWSDCQEGLPSFSLTKAKDEIHCHFGDKAKSIVFKAGEALNIFERISNESMENLGFNCFLCDDTKYETSDDWKDLDNKQHVHQFRPESMIFTVFPVIPSTARPYVIRDGERGEDDLTEKYNTIIKCCNKLEDDEDFGILSTKTKKKKMNESMRRKTELDLQICIWTLLDNKDEKSKLSNGGRPHRCLTVRIEGGKNGGKDGRVQSNINGKRCDFSARSVIIGGGIDLKNDELGVPKCIADELTKKEKVKEWNIRQLQQLVVDGQVNRIIRNTGGKRNIFRLNVGDRKPKVVLQINDEVERKLRDGDIVVFNRQPTLRMENMVAFKAKIISGYAFRLALCWTKGFNADYDGDEMNLHVPQSIGGTVEAQILMRAALRIVTGQRNAPINGVVQDGLVGAYILTNTWDGLDTDTMVKKETFMDCVVGAGIPMHRYNDLLNRAYHYYPEYIKESSTGYTISADEIPGKLMFSILFPANFGYRKETKINNLFPVVVVEDGILLPDSGPAEKKVIGGTADSVVHRLWKDYSPEVSLQFLSETQQLIDRWLPTHGFSMGISDCLATSEEGVARSLVELKTKVNEILESCGGIPGSREEGEINRILNSGMNIGLRIAKNLMNKGDRNALNIMRTSGAKGSIINLSQIVCRLGQTSVAGGRIPMKLAGGSRTLPHYHPNDHSAEARGFVSGNFITGLTPHETFFHAIGGREGIVATSIKTADTGYIQKKISAKIRDFHVEIDGTVRNSYGAIVQFLYGDDGMNPSQLCYVPSQKYPFPVNAFNIAQRLNSDAKREGMIDEDSFCRLLYPEEIDLVLSCIYSAPPHIDNEITSQANNNARENLKKQLSKVMIYPCKIVSFCTEIRDIFDLSRACYGDMVGLLATTSVGEPTTQLTLNTFHLSGVGSKDVSQGVPRFKELLNTTASKKQKKPSCTVFFDMPSINERTEKIDIFSETLHGIDADNEDLNEEKKVVEENITSLKEEIIEIFDEKKKEFEETTINTFFLRYKIRYLPSDVPPEKMISPVNIVTYEEYQKEWWVTLQEELLKMKGKELFPNGPPESWVVTIVLNTEELFRRKMKMSDIAEAIEDETDGNIFCIPSSDDIGKVNLYFNFSVLEKYAREKGKGSILLPPGETSSRPSLISENNINFFIVRHVMKDLILPVKLSGVIGISKIDFREEEGEWVGTVKCRPGVRQELSYRRYLKILAARGVDSYRTTVDDMHAIRRVLGIEAARRFLFEEMTRIISFDGTYINPRHIQLLVDGMTTSGEISAVQRGGISRREVGPIAKFTFEQPIVNASESALFGEADSLKSVSSAVMYGTSSRVGTGVVDIQRKDKIPTALLKQEITIPVYG